MEALKSAELIVSEGGEVIWTGSLESGELDEYADGGLTIQVDTGVFLSSWSSDVELTFDDATLRELTYVRHFPRSPEKNETLRRVGLSSIRGVLAGCNVGGYIIVGDDRELSVRADSTC